MIYFVCGRPGGGKSLFMAEKIYRELKRGNNVIANFEINMDYFRKCRHPEKLGRFIYLSRAELTTQAYLNIDPRVKEFSYIDGFRGFAKNFHDLSKEGRAVQTIIVLDEIGGIFNPRTYSARDRLSWVDFFTKHRKMKYDVYLIAQSENMVDKQIKDVFQKQIECRCIKNMKLFGKILAFLCGGNLFVAIGRDYTLMKPTSKKDSREYARYYKGKRFYDFYDSYELFE